MQEDYKTIQVPREKENVISVSKIDLSIVEEGKINLKQLMIKKFITTILVRIDSKWIQITKKIVGWINAAQLIGVF